AGHHEGAEDTGARRKRGRKFTAEYKLRVLREADACQRRGEIEALLRRAGLYASHLLLWRRQREEAAHVQLTSSRKTRPSPTPDARVLQLRRENVSLQRRLKRAETRLEIVQQAGRAQGLLGCKPGERKERLKRVTRELAPIVGIAPICAALGISR